MASYTTLGKLADIELPDCPHCWDLMHQLKKAVALAEDPPPKEVEPAEPPPQTITEELMRQAQVGWVVRTVGGASGEVDHTTSRWLRVKVKAYGHPLFYVHRNSGKLNTSRQSDYDIISLTPPETPCPHSPSSPSNSSPSAS